jgi:hypothetical protein
MESIRLFTITCFAVIVLFAPGCERTTDGEGTQSAANDRNKADASESESLAIIAPSEFKIAPAEPTNDDLTNAVDESDTPSLASPKFPPMKISDSWKRLSPKHEVWLDKANKQVVVGGQICLAGGPLEMLICPRNTKEHESVISANVESWQVHAALIALGASPGEACKWDPEYAPAWGPKIEIEVMWIDQKSGEIKTIDGRQWILNIETNKPMELDLVFGGSITETDEETGEKYYTGNDGGLICLANFSTATVDILVKDPQTQSFFEANTPKIPPLGTQVYAKIRAGEVVGKPE